MLKLKTKPCRYCKKPFEPKTPKHIVCSDDCVIGWTQKQHTKKLHTQARMERKALRERKEALKPMQQLFNECKTIAQKYARFRDRDCGCISCNKTKDWLGQWHGSHFRPAGNFKSVALNLLNIHKACSECNNFKSGNLVEYQDNLIKKIGQDKVDWLKSQTQPHRFTRDYLMRYRKVMTKRLNRLVARL